MMFQIYYELIKAIKKIFYIVSESTIPMSSR